MIRWVTCLLLLVLLLSASRQVALFGDGVAADFLSYRDSAAAALAGENPYLLRHPVDPSLPHYVAPPSSSALMIWMTWGDERTMQYIWHALNVAGLLLAGLGAAKLAGVSPWWGALAGLIWPNALLVVRIGNVVPLMAAGLIWGAIWLERRPAVSGVIVGVAAGLKLWPGILWFGLPRAGKAGAVVGFGLLGLLGLLLGPELTWWYLTHPGGEAGDMMALWWNVGLVGTVTRWLAY